MGDLRRARSRSPSRSTAHAAAGRASGWPERWRGPVPRRPGARPRARHQRQPRPGLRRARARARPATTTSTAGSTDAGLSHRGRPARARRRCRADETHLVVRAMRGDLRPAGRPAARSRAALRQPHPARPRARLVGGRDRRRGPAGPRAGRRRRRAAARRRPCCALAAELEGHPDNVAACLLGGLTVAWTDDGAAARGPRRAATRRSCRSCSIPPCAGLHRARPRAAAGDGAARRRRLQRRAAARC